VTDSENPHPNRVGVFVFISSGAQAAGRSGGTDKTVPPGVLSRRGWPACYLLPAPLRPAKKDRPEI
jgi:hypothetical protein